MRSYNMYGDDVRRDELLTELAKLETNGKNRRGSPSTRRQHHRQGTDGSANDSNGGLDTDGEVETANNANASMLSEDLRLLAALN